MKTESALVTAAKFNLLRQKTVEVRPRYLVGRFFVFSAVAVFAAIAVSMFFGDPIVVNVCNRLPAWCSELGHFFNHFGNGYNVFIPLAVALGILICTIPMKLNRAAHITITMVAVRVIYLLAATGLASIASTLAKWFFGRLRPKFSQHFSNLDFAFFTWTYNGAGLSFPSGHTTVAFSTAFALSTLAPQLRIPLFALAGLVGVSRVVLGAHYPSDVVAGAFCGIVVACLVSRAFARQRLGLVVTAKGAIKPKPWPRMGRFAALAGALSGELRGRPPASVVMQTTRPA